MQLPWKHLNSDVLTATPNTTQTVLNSWWHYYQFQKLAASFQLPPALSPTVKSSLPRSLCFFFLNSCCITLFFFFSFICISWRLITSQHFSGFCHTLTWISCVHFETTAPVLWPSPYTSWASCFTWSLRLVFWPLVPPIPTVPSPPDSQAELLVPSSV